MRAAVLAVGEHRAATCPFHLAAVAWPWSPPSGFRQRGERAAFGFGQVHLQHLHRRLASRRRTASTMRGAPRASPARARPASSAQSRSGPPGAAGGARSPWRLGPLRRCVQRLVELAIARDPVRHRMRLVQRGLHGLHAVERGGRVQGHRLRPARRPRSAGAGGTTRAGPRRWRCARTCPCSEPCAPGPRPATGTGLRAPARGSRRTQRRSPPASAARRKPSGRDRATASAAASPRRRWSGSTMRRSRLRLYVYTRGTQRSCEHCGTPRPSPAPWNIHGVGGSSARSA